MDTSKKVIAVSFPRSGHHLLADCLCQYFGRDLYLTTEKKAFVSTGNFNYCEYYNHCQKIPCSNPETNYQKNHDFNLLLSNNFQRSYIIQYRNPLEAIVSWYNLDTNPAYIEWLGRKPLVDNNGCKGWEKFANEKVLFWINFVEKWVLNNKNKNTIFISYEDLIAEPLNNAKNVIRFLGQELIDIKLLEGIIKKKQIKKQSNIVNFKYYNKAFFDGLRKKTKIIELKLRIFNILRLSNP